MPAMGHHLNSGALEHPRNTSYRRDQQDLAWTTSVGSTAYGCSPILTPDPLPCLL